MRICYITNPFEEPLSELRYASGNFGGVELSVDFPKALPDRLLPLKNGILDVLGSGGLQLIAHLPCYANLAEPYPQVRKANIGLLKESMLCAQELGIVKLVFHAGYLAGLGRKARDSARAFALEGLAQMESFAKERSIELCLENNPPAAGMFSTPEEITELLGRFDFKFTLDVGHLHLSGRSFKDLTPLLLERLAHVHLHDNSGDSDRHLPLGAGTVDYPGVISFLKKAGYGGTISLEVFSRDRDYLLLSKKKVESLL